MREQLADRPAPNDAVLTTTGISGTFTLASDGRFSDDSRIEVDLNGLESDSGLRDGYVKRTTLQTSRFPTATFVPTRTEGLTLPLADGALAFRLIGNMTISGVTKEVTWDVTGEKSGDRITVRWRSDPRRPLALLPHDPREVLVDGSSRADDRDVHHVSRRTVDDAPPPDRYPPVAFKLVVKWRPDPRIDPKTVDGGPDLSLSRRMQQRQLRAGGFAYGQRARRRDAFFFGLAGPSSLSRSASE